MNLKLFPPGFQKRERMLFIYPLVYGKQNKRYHSAKV